MPTTKTSSSTGCNYRQPKGGPPGERAEPQVQSPNGKPILRARSLVDGHYSELELPAVTRLALMLTPRCRGSFGDQAGEVLEVMQGVLENRSNPANTTIQTVFLRNASDQAECERLFNEHYGEAGPVTNFVVQPPCCGAALAVEAWAISGQGARVERFGPHLLTASYEGFKYTYCAGIVPKVSGTFYRRARNGFDRMRELLGQAGSRFEHVVRAWLYVAGITEAQENTSHYEQLNRARTDFFCDLKFGWTQPNRGGVRHAYPASTGIGTSGENMVMSCMALNTERRDVFLMPLENPHQTAAYAYDTRYSAKSPKFSRGVALITGNYITTWISGTASILNSETQHIGDVEAQTEQTIHNISDLIGQTNFEKHGIAETGARLSDLAKIRVYLKHSEDLPRCRAICERRFGTVPAIYVTADICRENLLVEIEGVAFSKRRISGQASKTEAAIKALRNAEPQ